MTYNHSGRLTLIGIVIAIALVLIFPPNKILRSDLSMSEKLNLRPGIDMVGGTSLTYEIKPPAGGFRSPDGTTLAESVASALKRRVDPSGVRNLVWRPEGDTRLEIQLPRNTRNEDASRIRDTYIAAQEKLAAASVSGTDVLRAVETLTGDARAARLAEFAGGNAVLQDRYTKLAASFDALATAKKGEDVNAEVNAGIEYEKLKATVEQNKLGVNEVVTVLSLPAEQRDKQLATLKGSAGSPQAVAAIDEFARAHAEYEKVKDTIDSVAQLKRDLRGSGVLEFHILVEPNDPEFNTMAQRLVTDGPRVRGGDRSQWFVTDRPGEFLDRGVEYGGNRYVLGWTTPDKSMSNPPGQTKWALDSAYRAQNPNGGNAVGFTFDSNGAALFGQLTGSNRGNQLAIILDNKIVSAANIDSQINGTGIITRQDGYKDAELKYLINTLNAGSLPATLAEEPIREQTVGPQIGAYNLRRGLLACGSGLLVVATFLIGYYYLAGAVAAVAVVLNVLLVLATMAAINATFTLPGIAGIVLTIGAAVDANVLIFERLREEQLRGLGIKAAIRNAYDRAFSAIIDSNVTTLITAVVLILLGTEEVKGFGVTLFIGLVWSLFTSLFVTKTVLDLLADKGNVRKLGSIPLSIPTWDKFLKPNIDWMGKAWAFMLFSALFITIGMFGFFQKLNEGKLLDVEFTRGTSVQFELKQEMKIDRVRERIEGTGLEAPSVVAVGNDEKTYSVITPEQSATKVQELILKALRDGDDSLLNVETPSTYTQVGEPFDAALTKAVLPIGDGAISVDDWQVPGLDSYTGGAAIVLRDINPRRSPTELADRIRRQQLQPQVGGADVRYSDFTVVAPEGPSVPSSVAVVLVSPGEFSYTADAERWRNELAGPMWTLVGEAVNTAAPLQSVRSIDPSVAADTQMMAFWAMVLSVIVIMVYIWLRFGNLKYGTATVLAMAHDTMLAIGAVGLAHYVVQYTPWLANALLIEPFRVNLTMVAGVLTVMSYSMIDTIVVFDRIRENRGKLGHVSRRVVNDSINQTLSRTLLTVGTTTATLLGMYVFGGPGIHGFTFVLLVGILVGTYSSIAIAAPFLLLGTAREPLDAVNKTSGQLQRA